MSKKNSRVNHQPPNVSLRSFGNCLNPPEWLTKSHVLPALVYTKKWQDIILRSLCSMTFLRSVWIWMFRKVAFQYHHTLEKTTWSCVSQPRNYKLSNVPKKNNIILSYGCFQKLWYPQIIHFNKLFHYKPSILGYHYFWKLSLSPKSIQGPPWPTHWWNSCLVPTF